MVEHLPGSAAPGPSTRTGAISGLGRSPLYDLSDYERLPDDGNRYEIIAGDVYMTPAPTVRHQSVSRDLGLLLVLWAREGTRGVVFHAPVDVELGPHDLVQPDLLYVSTARRGIITERRIVGAPDLMVEILSPTSAGRDRETKLKTYDRFGVLEYWLVDPDVDTVTVFAREASGRLAARRVFAGEETLVSELLPGFLAPLGEVFGIL
jgi:Uma2 family endonuclease